MKLAKIVALAAVATASLFAASCCPNVAAPTKPAYVAPAK